MKQPVSDASFQISDLHVFRVWPVSEVARTPGVSAAGSSFDPPLHVEESGVVRPVRAERWVSDPAALPKTRLADHDTQRLALDMECGQLPGQRMKPLVNLEEQIGKTVGRRGPPTGLRDSTAYTRADARDWQRAFRPPGIPRGVYRFASHEEADAWLTKMLTRVRPT